MPLNKNVVYVVYFIKVHVDPLVKMAAVSIENVL